MRPRLLHSVDDELRRSLEEGINARIEPMFGTQKGAESGYNPSRPIRSGHLLPTFVVSNSCLVLDV